MTDRSVSIITVVFNGRKFIENCILSVRSQTHPEVEHIIVDGASTDGTLDVLDRYKDDIRFISERDKGLFDAMNKGVALARNEWIFFLGADDVMASPRTLELLFAQCPADISPFSILTGHALYEDGRLSKCNRPSWLRWRNCIHHQGALYRRSLFSEQLFNISTKVHADYEFNIRAWQSGAKFFHTNQLLAVLGVGGVSDTAKWRNCVESMRMRARYFTGPVLWLGSLLVAGRYAVKVITRSLAKGA